MNRPVDISGADVANIGTSTLRAALTYARQRGYSSEGLCKGLGLTYEDLRRDEFRVSFRQASQLIQRIASRLNDPFFGLHSGATQTITSWGLTGVGMLISQTFGDAIRFGMRHQREIGALNFYSYSINDNELVLTMTPKISNPNLDTFLVQESFASITNVSRSVVGFEFTPLRVEFGLPPPLSTDAYKAFFKCPVLFNAGENRLVISSKWLNHPLRYYDEFISDSLLTEIETLIGQAPVDSDLIGSVRAMVRARLDNPVSATEVAVNLNISERTLRNRLKELGTTFSKIQDQMRFEKASSLIKSGELPLYKIAALVGYSDPKSFRLALRRWNA